MLFQSDRKSRPFSSGFPFREACNFFLMLRFNNYNFQFKLFSNSQ